MGDRRGQEHNSIGGGREKGGAGGEGAEAEPAGYVDGQAHVPIPGPSVCPCVTEKAGGWAGGQRAGGGVSESGRAGGKEEER